MILWPSFLSNILKLVHIPRNIHDRKPASSMHFRSWKNDLEIYCKFHPQAFRVSMVQTSTLKLSKHFYRIVYSILYSIINSTHIFYMYTYIYVYIYIHIYIYIRRCFLQFQVLSSSARNLPEETKLAEARMKNQPFRRMDFSFVAGTWREMMGRSNR